MLSSITLQNLQGTINLRKILKSENSEALKKQVGSLNMHFLKGAENSKSLHMKSILFAKKFQTYSKNFAVGKFVKECFSWK